MNAWGRWWKWGFQVTVEFGNQWRYLHLGYSKRFGITLEWDRLPF